MASKKRVKGDGYGRLTIQSLGSVEIDPATLAKGRAVMSRLAPDLLPMLFGEETAA